MIISTKVSVISSDGFFSFFAAIVSVDFSVKNSLSVNEVNVSGTLNVLRESLNVGVKRFVYAFSCAVYGESVHLPVDEKHQLGTCLLMMFLNLLLSIIVSFS